LRRAGDNHTTSRFWWAQENDTVSPTGMALAAPKVTERFDQTSEILRGYALFVHKHNSAVIEH
jgi:hypothetical protein